MNRLTNFLSNLLNRTISESDVIRITSAQRARLLSWAETNGIKVDFKRVQGSFRISDLMDGLHSGIKVDSNLDSLTHDSNKNAIGSISKVGIDIQSISEIFPLDFELDYSELFSIYSKYEIEYAKNSADPKATLAGFFSLKESLIKAGVQLASFADIEITHLNDGSPVYYGYEVSISHSGDFVTSIAIKRN